MNAHQNCPMTRLPPQYPKNQNPKNLHQARKLPRLQEQSARNQLRHHCSIH
jgi:hypothetical protein